MANDNASPRTALLQDARAHSLIGNDKGAERLKKNAEMTVNKERDAKGKANPLDKSLYDFKDLRFPLDVGTNGRLLHYIKFTPNIQQKSDYQVEKQKINGKEVKSFADTTSRFSDAIQGSFNPFGFGSAAGVAAGLAALGAATGAIDGVRTAGSVAELGAKTAVGGIGGFAVGAVAGALITGINLSRKTRRAAATICLYMPDTVVQTTVNDYDQVSMTQALGNAGLIAQAGGAITEGVIDQITEGKGGFGQSAGSAALAEVGGVVGEKTGAFGSGITDVLLFSAGYAQNPQVEVLFKSIQNREYLFDFKFTPRNKEEASAIIEIIKAFKFYAAPEIPQNANGRYFIPPSEFDIEFMIGSYRNAKLPRITTCVLQGIDVNYGSAGQWTTFEDGMPVEIAMQLRFKEVEVMHKKLIAEGF
jgi:hypothetical protein